MIVLSLVSWALASACSDGPAPLTRVAFGSCAVQDRPQPIWDAIVADRPDLFLFVGDNIYGDTDDMEELRSKYAQLASQPGYQRLLNTCPVLSVWDDHDYGRNDAGSWYPMRRQSQEVFLEFFEVPADSPRWKRPGIYDAQIFGPPGKRLQIILLDTRYFRSRFGRHELTEEQRALGFGPYHPNPIEAATMLGDEQWRWLEDQLQDPAEVRVIVSSIQVVSSGHGWEVWAQLPHERQRLFDLIETTGAGGVIIVSGDVHWGELSLYEDGPYSLYDHTSSALNQEYLQVENLPNQHRVGSAVYGYPNYGLIEVDWQQPDPTIRLALKDLEGEVVFLEQLALSELQPLS